MTCENYVKFKFKCSQFYWNTATFMYLCIAYGCFHATVRGLSSCRSKGQDVSSCPSNPVSNLCVLALTRPSSPCLLATNILQFTSVSKHTWETPGEWSPEESYSCFLLFVSSPRVISLFHSYSAGHTLDICPLLPPLSSPTVLHKCTQEFTSVLFCILIQKMWKLVLFYVSASQHS